MRRRSSLSAALMLVSLVVVIGSTLAVLLRHEPAFYRRSYVEPGPQRVLRSDEFDGQFVGMLSKFTKNGVHDEPFAIQFTQEQFNSFFAEGYIKHGLAGDLSKLGIHQPRITFEKDRIRLAFRYGDGPLSCIMSYDFRLWLAPHERNLLAIEILGHKAGGLPVPFQQALGDIKQIAEKHEVSLNWYRHQSRPVALVRFLSSNSPTMYAQFQQIEIEPGIIKLAGKSCDPNFEAPQDETVRN